MTNLTIVQSLGEFEKIINESQNCLICFFATWCGPCVKFDPVVRGMAILPEHRNISFVKVDIDEFPELAAKYSVTSVPYTVLVSKNLEKRIIIGLKDEEELYTILQNFYR